MHFFNTGDTPRLREVWVNYIYKPADEVTMNLGMLGALTAMNVPPHSTATISGACKAELVQLPVADAAARVSGGRSGLLVLNPGDSLSFSCDVVNDTDNTFHGLNEVNTDEMCHLFGSVAGLGFPCFL